METLIAMLEAIEAYWTTPQMPEELRTAMFAAQEDWAREGYPTPTPEMLNPFVVIDDSSGTMKMTVLECEGCKALKDGWTATVTTHTGQVIRLVEVPEHTPMKPSPFDQLVPHRDRQNPPPSGPQPPPSGPKK